MHCREIEGQISSGFEIQPLVPPWSIFMAGCFRTLDATCGVQTSKTPRHENRPGGVERTMVEKKK